MDVKGKVLLQLFYKSKLRNGTKTCLEQNFFLFIVKFKKLGFSAPLNYADGRTVKYHNGHPRLLYLRQYNHSMLYDNNSSLITRRFNNS